MENLSSLFKLECANEMTCYSWYSYVQPHNLPYKIVKIVFGSFMNAFCYNIKIYYIYNIFNLYHNVLICKSGQNQLYFFWKTINYFADGG